MVSDLITAAGGSPTIIGDLLAGTEDGYKAHLDGYNQMPLLLEGDKTVRKEVIYYEGTTLQAVRYNDWKATLSCKIMAGSERKKN